MKQVIIEKVSTTVNLKMVDTEKIYVMKYPANNKLYKLSRYYITKAIGRAGFFCLNDSLLATLFNNFDEQSAIERALIHGCKVFELDSLGELYEWIQENTD